MKFYRSLIYTLCHLRFDYSVAEDGANRFYPEIRKYYPHLNDGSLEPGYAGIRPKLTGPMQIPSDFIVQASHSMLIIFFQLTNCFVRCSYPINGIPNAGREDSWHTRLGKPLWY